jgi:hypothetical protein
MKMAVRMPDAQKVERDEIDENDWVQIQAAIEEALHNILTLERWSFIRKRISIANWKYSSIYD